VAERPYLSEREGDALVRVRLQPRARRDEIVGERAGALVVRVSAPPLEGRANDALCKLLAKAAGVAPGRASVVKGASARDKVVRLEGIGASDAGERLP
jgi:uncharacterized protein (TIGR00251 family)